jgi:hypothetical protein
VKPIWNGFYKFSVTFLYHIWQENNLKNDTKKEKKKLTKMKPIWKTNPRNSQLLGKRIFKKDDVEDYYWYVFKECVKGCDISTSHIYT